MKTHVVYNQRTGKPEKMVPADVAQGLYDIVDGERIRYEQLPPESELEMMHMAAILDALAAADGDGGYDD